MTATLIIGDVLDVLRSMPTGSVHSVITSPPYYKKRAYMPAGHPDGSKEIGQEPTPGDFLASLLAVTDELWRVVRDDGTIWFNLGDTASGSGGSGGDYNPGGQRENEAKWSGTARSATEHRARMPWKGAREGFPLAKSVCWLPELFGASLAYGRNLLTGDPCTQWITRPPVTWCKPNPPVGEIIDKFREATELIVWASKNPRYYFDLDAVREEPISDEQWATTKTNDAHAEIAGRRVRSPEVAGRQNKTARKTVRAVNVNGVPPKNWWEIGSQPWSGAHFAVMPPQLIVRPVIVSCPEGGMILDPFGGSGTTAMVATGHGRDCTLIDLDERNADLCRERVGMFLTVEHHVSEVVA